MYVYDRQCVKSLGANNMTGTATVVSDWICMDGLERLTFEVQAGGAANGAFSLEATNQIGADGRPSASATPIALTTPVTPAFPALVGAASATIHGLSTVFAQGGVKFLRLKYVNTSGAGPLDVFAHGSGPS